MAAKVFTCSFILAYYRAQAHQVSRLAKAAGASGAGPFHRLLLDEFIKHLTRRVSLEPTLVQQIKLDLVESLLIL